MNSYVQQDFNSTIIQKKQNFKQAIHKFICQRISHFL